MNTKATILSQKVNLPLRDYLFRSSKQKEKTRKQAKKLTIVTIRINEALSVPVSSLQISLL